MCAIATISSISPTKSGALKCSATSRSSSPGSCVSQPVSTAWTGASATFTPAIPVRPLLLWLLAAAFIPEGRPPHSAPASQQPILRKLRHRQVADRQWRCTRILQELAAHALLLFLHLLPLRLSQSPSEEDRQDYRERRPPRPQIITIMTLNGQRITAHHRRVCHTLSDDVQQYVVNM